MKYVMLFCFIFTSLLSTAYASPRKVDEFVIEAQAIFHGANPLDITLTLEGEEPKEISTDHNVGKALIMSRIACGIVEFRDETRPQVWKQRDTGGGLTKYTWFKVTEGDTEEDWFCEGTEIDISNAWKFNELKLADGYEPPKPIEPIIWNDVSDSLSWAVSEAKELIVVRRQTSGWQYSIRGSDGFDTWHNTGDRATAKTAAEAHIR